jgi:hypothetical protein
VGANVHDRDSPPATSTTSASTTRAPIMSRNFSAERGGFAGGPGWELTNSIVHHVVPVVSSC